MLESELALYAALQRRLGEQRIDIVVHRRDAPLCDIDRETCLSGVPLRATPPPFNTVQQVVGKLLSANRAIKQYADKLLESQKPIFMTTGKKESRYAGITDIAQSLKRWRVALYLAWSDTRARYRRSVLGPFWLTLGTAIGVAGLGWIWSELLKIDRAKFIPSLTAGLIVWQFLAGCITESTGLFVKQSIIIRNLQLPYFLHVLQLVFRHFVNFAHNLVVYIAVAVILAVPVTWDTLLVIPGVFMVAMNLLWITLLFGMLGARFRDLEYAVAALLPLLFFISPVIYRPGYLSFSARLIWLNPLSHFIEIIRDPMLGFSPPWFVYAAMGTMLVLGWGMTLSLFNQRRNRIAFWV